MSDQMEILRYKYAKYEKLIRYEEEPCYFTISSTLTDTKSHKLRMKIQLDIL